VVDFRRAPRGCVTPLVALGAWSENNHLAKEKMLCVTLRYGTHEVEQLEGLSRTYIYVTGLHG
jgi:hypothetical protein